MATKAIPEGYHTVTPHLVVRGAAKQIDFLKRAFGAEEKGRSPGPNGELMHAVVKIGDSMIMMADAMGGMEPMPMVLFLYVEDADALYNRALRAGATVVPMGELKDQFWGDRAGAVRDPFGNVWWIGTHVEDVSAEELERRMQEMMARTA